MTPRRVLLLLLLLLICIPTISVLASPLASTTNYCANATDPLCLTLFDGVGRKISEWVKSAAVALSQVIAVIAWICAKLVLVAYEMIVNGTWLEVFRNDLLGNMTRDMPQILKGISLGPTGVMYFALALSGIVMIVPMVASGTDRLVRPERVIIWGILLSVLFISGTAGYDVVGLVEELRVDIVRQMLGGNTTTGAVENLLFTPMKATAAEKELDIANLGAMPAGFVSAYYPVVVMEEVTVRLAESSAIFSGILNTTVETAASASARSNGATQALLYSVIELAAAAVILGFALAFIFLGIAALVLILFLMAALPLGFFEFGNVILTKIVERYVLIVTLSMVLALFMRVSGGLMTALPNADSTSGVVEWLLLLGALFVSLYMIFGMAWKALTDSFSTFTNSVRLATGMPSPAPGQGLISTAGRVATGAVVGALTGRGVMGALMGAAGGVGAGSGGGAGKTESPPRAENPLGNVFDQNGYGNSMRPTAAKSGGISNPINAPASAFQTQINLQPLSAPALLKEVKPAQTPIAEETARAVSASKSLFPDER